VQENLPNTALHVLSNGRLFKDLDFALTSVPSAWTTHVRNSLYSDNPADHDFIVQANALSRRHLWMMNLERAAVRTEIRIVLHP